MTDPSQEAIRRAWDFCKNEHPWDSPCDACMSLARAFDSFARRARLEEARKLRQTFTATKEPTMISAWMKAHSLIDERIAQLERAK